MSQAASAILVRLAFGMPLTSPDDARRHAIASLRRHVRPFAALMILSVACTGREAATRDSTPASPRVPEPTFEVALWPGEGIPVIHSVRDSLVLSTAPREGAPAAGVLRAKPGEPLRFDSTRYQTVGAAFVRALRPVTVEGRDLGARRFLAREEYYSGAFPDTTMTVAPPDSIEFLQHRAEGSCFVRIRGHVVDADPCPVFLADAFTPAAPPRTDWWVFVAGKAASGWLRLGDSTARVVDRRF
jgi:hypothetical protein